MDRLFGPRKADNATHHFQNLILNSFHVIVCNNYCYGEGSNEKDSIGHSSDVGYPMYVL